jgi:hypothetical protein
MHRLVPIALLALCACRTTTQSLPPNSDSAIVMRTTPVRAWELLDAGKRLGSVVRYETPDHAQAYFSVRNEHGQELGVVDIEGRAWRYRAHQREPDWLLTGTVVQGARAILEASPRAELLDVSLEALLNPSPR